jgi:hypothetical protein
MSSIVVEKEIYGSSLCWWPGDPTIPTGAVDSELGQSYDLNACAVEVWRARGKNGEGLPPMRVKKVSIEPLWASSYLDPFTFLSTDYYFKDVIAQPFIRDNKVAANLYAFSATSDFEFKVNQWGPQSNLDVVNDFHMDDEFVVNEQESLMIRLSGAQIVGAGTGANAIKNAMWDAWRESVVIKVRFEMVPHDPTERYFSRTNFNDLDWKPPGKVDLLTDTELTLLDLRQANLDITPALSALTDTNEFLVSSLDFRGAYPWGGYNSGSRYMYSIILHTEGKPSDTKNIRKYIRYSGGNASDLERNGLLKDIGPIAMKKGQWLTVKIFLFEFALNSTAASATYRQMPAIWLNGSIT